MGGTFASTWRIAIGLVLRAPVQILKAWCWMTLSFRKVFGGAVE